MVVARYSSDHTFRLTLPTTGSTGIEGGGWRVGTHTERGREGDQGRGRGDKNIAKPSKATPMTSLILLAGQIYNKKHISCHKFVDLLLCWFTSGEGRWVGGWMVP